MRTTTTRLCAFVALALASCAPTPAPEPRPADFRRAGAPIASVAIFDEDRFAGLWYQTADFGPGCAGTTATLQRSDRGIEAQTACAGRAERSSWVRTAPARYQTPQGPVWVLWVDEGYRTAVLGAPDGRWGAVWNRAPQIPGDRAAAAREILDFNGYDLTRIRKDAQ